MSGHGNWTDERVERFKSFYARDWTHTQIGIELGITRNASIGKAHRLKLPARSLAGTERRPKKSGPPKRRTKVMPKPRPNVSCVDGDLPPDQSSYAVPFLARASNGCAWPLWTDATPPDQRMFCNAPQLVTGDGAHCWCPRHCRIGYAKPGERRGGFRRKGAFSHSGVAGYA